MANPLGDMRLAHAADTPGMCHPNLESAPGVLHPWELAIALQLDPIC